MKSKVLQKEIVDEGRVRITNLQEKLPIITTKTPWWPDQLYMVGPKEKTALIAQENWRNLTPVILVICYTGSSYSKGVLQAPSPLDWGAHISS